MAAWVHVHECGSPRGSTCTLTETICLPSWLSQKTPSRRCPGPTHSLTHSITTPSWFCMPRQKDNNTKAWIQFGIATLAVYW
jgi:hypothetical protein